MSTLEKFGILVILILVVIIGVVAVWGVGGSPDANPFADGAGADVAATGDALPPPDGTVPPPGEPAWPGEGTAQAPAPGPVEPPALGASVTPPAPTPAAQAATYTVQKGDTLARISQKTLGDANRHQEILAANPGVDPRRLRIGMTLNIPSRSGVDVAGGKPKTGSKPAVAPNTFQPNPEGGTKDAPGPDPAIKSVAPAPAAAPDSGMREVEIRSGDTFYKLALQYLGNADYHYKIQQANPGVDPRKLRPGMKVKVPAN